MIVFALMPSSALAADTTATSCLTCRHSVLIDSISYVTSTISGRGQLL